MAKMNYAARRAEDLLREHPPERAPVKKPRPQPTRRSPRQIRAKLPGTCATCNKPFDAGDPILWAPGYTAHVIHRAPKRQARTKGGLTISQATLDDYDRMTPRAPADRHGTPADTRYL